MSYIDSWSVVLLHRTPLLTTLMEQRWKRTYKEKKYFGALEHIPLGATKYQHLSIISAILVMQSQCLAQSPLSTAGVMHIVHKYLFNVVHKTQMWLDHICSTYEVWKPCFRSYTKKGSWITQLHCSVRLDKLRLCSLEFKNAWDLSFQDYHGN